MKSRYNATREITPAQYIAEVMCERRAKSLDTELPDRFWELPEWRKFFVYQVMIANSFVKKYGKSRTLVAIVRKVDKRLWSLKHPAVERAISNTTEVFVKKTELDIINEHSVGRQTRKRTILDILDDLEA